MFRSHLFVFDTAIGWLPLCDMVLQGSAFFAREPVSLLHMHGSMMDACTADSCAGGREKRGHRSPRSDMSFVMVAFFALSGQRFWKPTRRLHFVFRAVWLIDHCWRHEVIYTEKRSSCGRNIWFSYLCHVIFLVSVQLRYTRNCPHVVYDHETPGIVVAPAHTYVQLPHTYCPTFSISAS
jgi:hypothetical protein